MKDEYVPFYVRKDGRNAFLACLGLGTLYAIRQGVLPAEAGIWSLGRPRVRAPLERASDKTTEELFEVLSTADELDAIQKLVPREFDEKVDQLIKRLQSVLESGGGHHWTGGWSLPPAE